MCDEDHSIWFSGPPWGILAQWMELARFYNCNNRVSISFHINEFEVHSTAPGLHLHAHDLYKDVLMTDCVMQFS